MHTTLGRTTILVFLGFLVMSFADGIGVAVARISEAYQLPKGVVAALPSFIFVWFAFLSVPTGSLCVRLGRRRVAIGSLALTAFALFMPLFDVLSPCIISVLAFALLGIASVGLQVALPPMLASCGPRSGLGGRAMACLTGKTAMASVIPLAFGVFAALGSWRLTFLMGGLMALAVSVLFARRSDSQCAEPTRRASTFSILGLLSDPFVFSVVLAFALAICQDVWLNLAMPGMLSRFYGWEGSRCGLGASVYFAAKIPAMLAGSVLLPRFRPSAFAIPSVALVIGGIAVLCLAPPVPVFFTSVLAVSLGSANFYGIFFGMLAARHPDRLDALSSLLVMSISAGALVGPMMAIWRP